MKKTSTLICIVDNQMKPSVQVIDLDKFMNDVDTQLDALFSGFEIQAPSFSTKKFQSKMTH